MCGAMQLFYIKPCKNDKLDLLALFQSYISSMKEFGEFEDCKNLVEIGDVTSSYRLIILTSDQKNNLGFFLIVSGNRILF